MTIKTTFPTGSAPALAPLATWLQRLRRRAEAVPYDLIAIGARIFPAAVFFELTRMDPPAGVNLTAFLSRFQRIC